ncbi:hypothetical protein AK830_g8613, partial [Neonectria ditissima]
TNDIPTGNLEMAAAAYIPEAYDSLPSLNSANQQLQDKGGEGVITGSIRNIFLHHRVNETYGVALLHKHFQIQSTERRHCAAVTEILEWGTEELSAFLRQNGLDQVLGLRLLDSRDPDVSIEVTEGTSNIMLPQGAIDGQQLIPAMWIFGNDEDDRCNCMEYCFMDRSGKHTGNGTHGCG